MVNSDRQTDEREDYNLRENREEKKKKTYKKMVVILK